MSSDANQRWLLSAAEMVRKLGRPNSDCQMFGSVFISSDDRPSFEKTYRGNSTAKGIGGQNGDQNTQYDES